MSRDVMQSILQKIKEYDRILLFRHTRCDGDCVGATKGLARILKLTYPEKEIRILDGQRSSYLAFLGYDESPDALSDEEYATALGLVLDTGSERRISNPKYALCRELIKLDHHIDREPYGNISWVEEHRSSTCEMVVAFYNAFSDELKIDREAATYLFTGMVTDSGRFRFREVSGETMRMAATLLDLGVPTDRIYANLYMQDYELLKFKAYVLRRIRMTENGVAYLHVTRAMQRRFHLTHEQAGAVVSHMDSIKNSLIWIAFIDGMGKDRATRVRLRSRFVTVNEVAEQFRGGGHEGASGATVYGKREVRALLSMADARLKEYKETHEGWL